MPGTYTRDEHGRLIHAAHNNRWKQRHPDKARAIKERGDLKLKLDVLGAYGNGRVACVRCGFDDIRALSLDHISGGGNAHRHENNGRFSGQKLYVYLRQNDYPLGYQTLCMNCQWIKRSENREYR